MAGWSQDVFERECLAWMDKLKSNPAGSELVCLEFSHWQYQPNYLYRRLQVHDQTDAEVHIAWSSSYQCPLLLMRSSQNDFKRQPSRARVCCSGGQ
ncbi:hypothetical protein BASA81_000575 [Batrachochytrium salamandrivorans]|nr:hypothetical protein BASA81_000575 [Batrachochytrium salamandrivorans]